MTQAKRVDTFNFILIYEVRLEKKLYKESSDILNFKVQNTSVKTVLITFILLIDLPIQLTVSYKIQ